MTNSSTRIDFSDPDEQYVRPDSYEPDEDTTVIQETTVASDDDDDDDDTIPFNLVELENMPDAPPLP